MLKTLVDLAFNILDREQQVRHWTMMGAAYDADLVFEALGPDLEAFSDLFDAAFPGIADEFVNNDERLAFVVHNA